MSKWEHKIGDWFETKFGHRYPITAINNDEVTVNGKNITPTDCKPNKDDNYDQYVIAEIGENIWVEKKGGSNTRAKLLERKEEECVVEWFGSPVAIQYGTFNKALFRVSKSPRVGEYILFKDDSYSQVTEIKDGKYFWAGGEIPADQIVGCVDKQPIGKYVNRTELCLAGGGNWIGANVKVLYQEDGKVGHPELPSVISERGAKAWHKDGLYHRDNNQPSIVWDHEEREHYLVNGEYHRTDGPAVVSREYTSYFLKGIKLSKEEWEKETAKSKQPEEPLEEMKIFLDGWYKTVQARKEGDHYVSPRLGWTFWLKGDKVHRDNDLPALIDTHSMDQYWYQNGVRHRTTGPARIHFYGRPYNFYYIDGKQISQSEFNQIITSEPTKAAIRIASRLALKAVRQALLKLLSKQFPNQTLKYFAQFLSTPLGIALLANFAASLLKDPKFSLIADELRIDSLSMLAEDTIDSLFAPTQTRVATQLSEEAPDVSYSDAEDIFQPDPIKGLGRL